MQVKKSFHGFGYIPWQLIVGVIHGSILGATSASQADTIRKAQRKTGSTLDLLHRQRLSDIKAAGATKEEELGLKAEAAVLEEKSIKMAAFAGVTVTILASLVLVYFLFRGKREK